MLKIQQKVYPDAVVWHLDNNKILTFDRKKYVDTLKMGVRDVLFFCRKKDFLNHIEKNKLALQ